MTKRSLRRDENTGGRNGKAAQTQWDKNWPNKDDDYNVIGKYWKWWWKW